MVADLSLDRGSIHAQAYHGTTTRAR
jgi:hypothetical protein